MYINRVELRNIRQFRQVRLRFDTESGRPLKWSLLLGDNATGKTTLLRSIALGDEYPTLIDPVQEDPEAFVGFDWQFGPVPLAKPIGRDAEGRGTETIRLLGLDREFLNDERGRLLLGLQALARKMQAALYLPNSDRLLRETEREIKKATSAVNEFAGFRRDFFRKQNLEEYIADD